MQQEMELSTGASDLSKEWTMHKEVAQILLVIICLWAAVLTVMAFDGYKEQRRHDQFKKDLEEFVEGIPQTIDRIKAAKNPRLYEFQHRRIDQRQRSR